LTNHIKEKSNSAIFRKFLSELLDFEKSGFFIENGDKQEILLFLLENRKLRQRVRHFGELTERMRRGTFHAESQTARKLRASR